jgi:hypothetical protein
VRGWSRCAAVLIAVTLAACQTLPSHEQLVNQQLGEAVATQAPECESVRAYRRFGRLDYRVECLSGAFYRVRVDAGGRVAVTREALAPVPASR